VNLDCVLGPHSAVAVAKARARRRLRVTAHSRDPSGLCSHTKNAANLSQRGCHLCPPPQAKQRRRPTTAARRWLTGTLGPLRVIGEVTLKQIYEIAKIKQKVRRLTPSHLHAILGILNTGFLPRDFLGIYALRL
jgi:hypothetical protein